MTISRNLTIILLFYICVSICVPKQIAWDIDLVYDPNTNAGPLASCINNDGSGIYAITKIVPRGSFLHKEGNCVLWEVGGDGNIAWRTLLKEKDGKAIKTNALAIGPGCAMASGGPDNLLTAGVIAKQSLAVISTEHNSNIEDPNILEGSQINDFSIKEIISLENDTFALIGDRLKDGFYLRIDDQGKIMKEVPFDMSQTEKFTGAAQLKSNSLNLAVVGLSVGKSEKEWNDSVAENFILIYDPNDILIYEDHFTGVLPGIIFPKVCCLTNGNIVMVFFNKLKEDSDAGLWARCYTQKLKLLWEKEIFSVDEPSFLFDMTLHSSDAFIVAKITPAKGVGFFAFNENGNRIGFVEYKGMVGMSGFNLIRMHNRTIAVFEEGSPGNIQELTIKAKVIALD